jgi:hypothetical protein
MKSERVKPMQKRGIKIKKGCVKNKDRNNEEVWGAFGLK